VGTAVDCAGAGDDCNLASCDPSGGEGNCDILTPVENGLPCDDDDACTTGDACLNGSCTGAPVDCSDLDDDCNVGVCAPGTGLCEAQPANEGGLCSDGDACTTGETCTAGNCSGGAPVDCSNLDDDCNVGVCSPASGLCEAQPANEGGPCDGGAGTCMAGECVIQGECTTDEDCEDAIACTVDTCDLAMGGVCMHAPDDALCDDGLPCTSDVCDPSMGCDNINTCPPETPLCTIDGCVECLTAEDCQDDDACTVNEDCVANQCVSDTVDCSTSGDECNTASCDPAGAPGNCDILTPLPDGTLCMDGSGVCMNGQCVTQGECTTDEDCEDAIACTVDTCDLAMGGVCVNDPQDELCDDGLFCNGAETCHPTAGCQPGTPPCTPAQVCDEDADQCIEPGCEIDEDCTDGLACNGQETCDTGSGDCLPGVPVQCAPGEVCTEPSGMCVAPPEDCIRTLVIKGGACPASYNLNSMGFLPVFLAGDLGFDVSDIDLSSLELRRCDGAGGVVQPSDGPPGPPIEITDEVSPSDAQPSCEDGIDCACQDGDDDDGDGDDGITDLNMKFLRVQLTDVLQLDDFSAGDVVVLELSGVTHSGVSFCARDCIRIVGGGNDHRDD
jgi:hypothetical protein